MHVLRSVFNICCAFKTLFGKSSLVMGGTDMLYETNIPAEEVSRCLLCDNAACTQACPNGVDPAKFCAHCVLKIRLVLQRI